MTKIKIDDRRQTTEVRSQITEPGKIANPKYQLFKFQNTSIKLFTQLNDSISIVTMLVRNTTMWPIPESFRWQFNRAGKSQTSISNDQTDLKFRVSVILIFPEYLQLFSVVS